MPTFEYDRRYVERGLEMLESYLLADSAYWPMNTQAPLGEPAYPMLTLEGLKLSLLRMSAFRGRLVYEYQTQKLTSELEAVRKRWAVAWEKKAQGAYRARLTMWGNYIEEYRDLPEAHADRYIYEVRLRAFLSILEQDVGTFETNARAQLSVMDTYLNSVLVRGKFIWDDNYRASFPAEEYWYLYGLLPPHISDRSRGTEKISGEGHQ